MTAAEKLLKEHIDDANRRFDRITETVELIRSNHLHHLAEDITGVKTDMAGVKTEMGWHKWIITTAAGAAIVGAVSGVINMMM